MFLNCYSIQYFYSFFFPLHSAGFEWYDKSTPQFFNWEKGEPSGKTQQRGNQENCVEVQTWNGAWNDIDCSSLRGYVCEKLQSKWRLSGFLYGF